MMKQEMKSIKRKKRKHMIPSTQTKEYVIVEDENPLSNDKDEDDKPIIRTKKSNYNSLKNISDSKQDSRLLKKKRGTLLKINEDSKPLTDQRDDNDSRHH